MRVSKPKADPANNLILYNKYLLYSRMTIATRGQTVGLDSADNQTNVQVSNDFIFYPNLYYIHHHYANISGFFQL